MFRDSCTFVYYLRFTACCLQFVVCDWRCSSCESGGAEFKLTCTHVSPQPGGAATPFQPAETPTTNRVTYPTAVRVLRGPEHSTRPPNTYARVGPAPQGHWHIVPRGYTERRASAQRRDTAGKASHHHTHPLAAPGAQQAEGQRRRDTLSPYTPTHGAPDVHPTHRFRNEAGAQRRPPPSFVETRVPQHAARAMNSRLGSNPWVPTA